METKQAPWEASKNAYGVWFVHGGKTLSNGITVYRDLICGGNGINTLSEENAMRIVRAVNCHDELLAALILVTQRCRPNSSDGAIARAAIAKAKGLATDDTSCNKPTGEAITEKDVPY